MNRSGILSAACLLLCLPLAACLHDSDDPMEGWDFVTDVAVFQQGERVDTMTPGLEPEIHVMVRNRTSAIQEVTYQGAEPALVAILSNRGRNLLYTNRPEVDIPPAGVLIFEPGEIKTFVIEWPGFDEDPALFNLPQYEVQGWIPAMTEAEPQSVRLQVSPFRSLPRQVGWDLR
jgi:hypothetical protein